MTAEKWLTAAQSQLRPFFDGWRKELIGTISWAAQWTTPGILKKISLNESDVAQGGLTVPFQYGKPAYIQPLYWLASTLFAAGGAIVRPFARFQSEYKSTKSIQIAVAMFFGAALAFAGLSVICLALTVASTLAVLGACAFVGVHYPGKQLATHVHKACGQAKPISKAGGPAQFAHIDDGPELPYRPPMLYTESPGRIYQQFNCKCCQPAAAKQSKLLTLLCS